MSPRGVEGRSLDGLTWRPTRTRPAQQRAAHGAGLALLASVLAAPLPTAAQGRTPAAPAAPSPSTPSAAATSTPAAATAQPAAPPIAVDRYSLRAHSATYLRMFERALLPGPGGASVDTEGFIPIHEYLTLRATDLDSPWHRDSIDLEVAAWGTRALAAPEGERSFDGDVTVANVAYRWGPGTLKLGRQMTAGAAAGLAQLDGISAGVRTTSGFGVSGYGGLSVLPRWAERPGYHHLGSAADSLLESPDAFPEPSRSGNWMVGARADYVDPSLLEAGLSVHEERQFSELGRRDVAADVHLSPIQIADLTLQGVMDLDSARLAQALAAVDVYPAEDWELSAEYRRVDPARLMSRHSVLSVFVTDAFDEVGGRVGYRILPGLRLGSRGYLELFGPGELGMRADLRLRAAIDPAERLFFQVAYGRVSEPENGYHSVRASVSYRFIDPLAATAEHYAYFYDVAIRGLESATVEMASLQWKPLMNLRLLLGGSVSSSPYAELDAQTMLRVVYGYEVAGVEP